MQKELGSIGSIVSNDKTIESRWYLSRKAPWQKVKKGETIFFKYSGGPVLAKAEVAKVLEFENLNPQNVRRILKEFGSKGKLDIQNLTFSYNLYKNKKYCVLIFLKNPEKIKPFKIDKTGFGISSAWLCIPEISTIKR